MKKVFFITIIGIVVLLSACSGKEPTYNSGKLNRNTTAISVEDSNITVGQILDETEKILLQYEENYGEIDVSTDEGLNFYAQIQGEVANRLVEVKIMDLLIHDEGVSVLEEEIDLFLETEMRQEDVDNIKTQQGWNQEELREEVKRVLAMRHLRETITQNIELSPETLEEEFEKYLEWLENDGKDEEKMSEEDFEDLILNSKKEEKFQAFFSNFADTLKIETNEKLDLPIIKD